MPAATPPIPPNRSRAESASTHHSGAIYAPNLTPDRDTGIGAWTDTDFTRAVRTGVAPDGSNYYPAFPYPYFTRMTKDDTLAIRAYLGTLAAVTSRNKPPELRWPFGYRGLMRIWNMVYFKPGLFEPDQSQSAAWNRGGYLVTGLGHCGACHTPKNYFGADKQAQALAGNEVGGWYAPRLDGAARTGLKSWKCRRHHGISSERAQRQEPCQRADGGGGRQFDFEDERCRRARDRGLPEEPAAGTA
ncbi:mono/diheme cytochrome c family protein [Bradyrhizobium sp. GM5.1]